MHVKPISGLIIMSLIKSVVNVVQYFCCFV